jgi:hypothetical protein
MDSSSENDHHQTGTDDHSPESAGLARGLVRAAARQGAGRVAVGRLPLPKAADVAKTSTKVAAETTRHTAATASRFAKIKKVARVSDRASTGFDLVDAASTSEDSPSSKKKSSIRTWTRVSNFIGNLTKNTILGTAVFVTYEDLIDRFDDGKNNNSSIVVAIDPSIEEGNASSSIDPYKNNSLTTTTTTLPQHYAAGYCAGSVHACLGRVIDVMYRMQMQLYQQWYKQKAADKNISSIVSSIIHSNNPPFSRYLLHHATSHTVLFGSYETTKRLTTLVFPPRINNNDRIRINNNNTTINDEDIVIGGNGNENDDDDYSSYFDDRFFIVAFAGGIAGISQQIISDYTEQLMTQQSITRKNWPSINKPNVKSLLLAFIPTAIGFVAFEYGREVISP